ncbi:hypothetical protein K438DRAFT_1875131 [Mycena galopus ATCC 62051]|nr:hypothetical protein K438DRAFT_1875131 [Mycena galopus ATCC 62051]
MSPPFLWLLIGAGVGSWWTAHKRFNRDNADCYQAFYGHHRSLQGSPSAVPNPNSLSQKAPLNSSEPGTADYPTAYNRDWEQERARVRQFSRSAEDTVVELSEVTLNTILQATEALKAKMGEHRALREEGRRLEEERSRNPPRYV